MKIKFLSLLCIIVICLVSLTGCYDAQGIENLAYVVALGIDKGENNKIKLSLQIALPSDSSSGGDSSQSEQSTVTTIDCASINTGITLINSYISKKINLAHCKAIVISEDLAYEGISEYIYTLVNNVEIRPDCNIIISRSKASEYLEHANATLESVSARYYEFTLNSSEYTGYTQNITLEDFFSNMVSTTSEAYAILGGINSNSTHANNSDMPIYDIDGSYKANETPIETKTDIENMGIAVFKYDKLVGELTGMESLSHLLITNELQNATISIPNPYNSSATISIYIATPKKPKTTTKLIYGTPYIEYDVFVEATVLSLDENFNSSDSDSINLIEDYASSYLEQSISEYLYKTSKEYKTDIANTGKYFLKNHLTWEDWKNSDWLSNYENAFFKVNVNTNIESSQLFTKV